jgi:hypothetical protein
MGIAAPPVFELDTEEAWGYWCNKCEVPHIQVTSLLLEYGDRDFMKHNAYHEICHVKLGHTEAWFQEYLDIGEDKGLDMLPTAHRRAEWEVENCLDEFSEFDREERGTQYMLARTWQWYRDGGGRD